MKKLLAIAFLIIGIMSIKAQEEGTFRVGLDLGYVVAKNGSGALFSVEPKYNITANSNIGIRFGLVFTSSSGESEIGSNINILATYDYYFIGKNSSITPFLGVGMGYFGLSDIKLDFFGDSYANLGGQFGALIRGGVELGKFRIALEYNILPISDLEYGESIKNSYLGASLGFYLGGGNWKN